MAFEEAAYSEARYARAVADAAGADHYERLITADELLGEFDRILRAMDQPTVDGVNTYFVSQTARQAGLTVALSGLGGDELFGGYPNTFQDGPLLLKALSLAQAFPGGVGLARSAISLLPNHRRWARLQDALTRPASLASAYFACRGLFSPSEVQAMLVPEVWHDGRTAFDAVTHIMDRAGDVARNSRSRSTMSWTSRAELRTYTHHQLLRDTDVMSMAHSLEVRVPLLDVRLVEWMICLPDQLKQTWHDGPKPLLMRAMHDQLPAIVRQRRHKQGFTFPFAPWLRGPLKARSSAILEHVRDRGWLRPGITDAVFRDYQAGRVHWSRLWSLLALGSIG
jgi:asparagine synthase (glutamine-hydrolysing)